MEPSEYNEGSGCGAVRDKVGDWSVEKRFDQE